MPRVDYPKSRRLLLQAVLCLILAASVGLAALVTHDRRRSSTPLAGTRFVESIGIRLPTGWILQQTDRGPIVIAAREPDTINRKGRRILIKKWQVDPTLGLSAEDFLQSSGLLDGTVHPVAADPTAPQPITLAGLPGAMLMVQRPFGGFLIFQPTGYETEVLAGSVRPSGLAISLQLDCPDDTDPQADQQLLRDIAAAMQVRDSGEGS